MNDNIEIPPIPEPDPLIEQLKPFLVLNPKAEAVRAGDKAEIHQPWDDPSVAFYVEDGRQDVVDALNSVYLPPPYVAIWHADSKDIEFIYSALPVDSAVIGRSFRFLYLGKEIVCEYAQASERLLTLSRVGTCKFTGTETRSTYRNLYSFQGLMKYRTDPGNILPENPPPPTSFWVRNVDWEDRYVSDLCKHINFYVYYFDRRAPCIVILRDTPDALGTPDRYPHDGKFPSAIQARPLNSDLLDLLAICRDTADPIRRIIHSFQALEYVAHYYTKNEALRAIRRLLIAPNAIDKIDSVLEGSIDAMTEWIKNEDERMRKAIKDYVDPGSLWPVLEHYRDTFGKDITFDGGYVQAALIKPETRIEDLDSDWMDSFFKKWKDLRNVVVHARTPAQPKNLPHSSQY